MTQSMDGRPQEAASRAQLDQETLRELRSVLGSDFRLLVNTWVADSQLRLQLLQALELLRVAQQALEDPGQRGGGRAVGEQRHVVAPRPQQQRPVHALAPQLAALAESFGQACEADRVRWVDLSPQQARLVESPHPYFERGRMLVVYARNKRSALVMESNNDGRVITLRGGRLPDVTWLEACS
mgnify:CR=1 FL=1